MLRYNSMYKEHDILLQLLHTLTIHNNNPENRQKAVL